MTTQIEALKLALEALEGWGKGFPDNWGDLDTEAVTAIKEALAQQSNEQVEPVAFIDEQGTLRYYKSSDFNQCEYGGLVRLYKEKT